MDWDGDTAETEAAASGRGEGRSVVGEGKTQRRGLNAASRDGQTGRDAASSGRKTQRRGLNAASREGKT